MRFGGCKRPTVVCPRMVSMRTSWRQGGGGAPVLRPTLAGRRDCLHRAAASSPLCTAILGGDREWRLRPGAPPPPCASGVACHALACHPGAGAGGLGHGRRHHSRWLRPSHEQTLLMARRLRTENGAPRAWAGERAPGHLPLLYACTQPAAKVSNWPITAGPPDAGLIDARHGRTAGVSSGMPAARCIRYSSSAVSSSLPKA